MNNNIVSGGPHGTLRSYLAAFSLSLVLTAVPFILVMTSGVSRAAIVPVITVFAVSQIAVHLLFFLHLNRRSEQPFKLTIFMYSLIILAILIGASIWIMHHLDAYHMISM